MRADLHGALIRVAQSRNHCSVVGLVGIVLVESKLAFQIVTRAD
jgi:RNase P/RNase MRP subunit p29